MQEPDNDNSLEKNIPQTQSIGKSSTEIRHPVNELSEQSHTENQSTLVSGPSQLPTLDNSDDSSDDLELGAPIVPKDEAEVADPKESITSKVWRHFVDEVANHASVSLVSLLRNSVVLELSEKELVIGYQNIQVFTETKRTKIEEIARDFFNDSIRVVFKESDDGLDDSLQVKHDNAKAKEIVEIKTVAKNDISAQEVLKIFPSAEIVDITILDEPVEGKK